MMFTIQKAILASVMLLGTSAFSESPVVPLIQGGDLIKVKVYNRVSGENQVFYRTVSNANFYSQGSSADGFQIQTIYADLTGRDPDLVSAELASQHSEYGPYKYDYIHYSHLVKISSRKMKSVFLVRNTGTAPETNLESKCDRLEQEVDIATNAATLIRRYEAKCSFFVNGVEIKTIPEAQAYEEPQELASPLE
jgi:hypothetical protein